MKLGWVGHPDIIELARRRFRCCPSSQAPEDLCNAAKNSRLVKGKKRFRKVEQSYAAMVSRQVVDNTHRYIGIRPDVPAPASAALSKETFRAPPRSCSLDTSGLVSAKATPDWYTCTPDDYGRAHTDVQLLGDMHASGDFTKAPRTWLSKLCDASHRFVMRKKSEPDTW